MVVRYKRKKDGKVLSYAQPIPRLDRSDQFERVVDKPEPKPKPPKPDEG